MSYATPAHRDGLRAGQGESHRGAGRVGEGTAVQFDTRTSGP